MGEIWTFVDILATTSGVIRDCFLNCSVIEDYKFSFFGLNHFRVELSIAHISKSATNFDKVD